ncbi:hypothetical protein B9Z35_10025 [Limnohabitans sp. Jir61]|uniref:hypothetical protein n=1 Tax=Limnohabitans sp. Jir61 TaxID=1826168 RepID=UPI000D391E98|nr:hypothetical protein [Limnohabitans sp. Jir61]PUE29523.1 hypothetical protein B9Z35_10025 [Limnohabitans sp. Jir61]
MGMLKHYLLFLGMYGVGISLLLGGMVSLLIPIRYAGLIHTLSKPLTYAAFIFTASCSILYLFYPNFIDHLEPTITQITLIWMQGGDLYPPIDAPSKHGLLYGPALYWVQYPFLAISNDLILSSKLPSVLAFNAACCLLFYSYKNALSRAYLLLLLPFNLILFWNRAEPYFVLLVALAVFVIEQQPKSQALLLGVLAGLASSFKAHGILYILPFLIFFCNYSFRHSVQFAIAFSLICLSFFLDRQTSLLQYFEYLKLATMHGISFAYFEKNLFFLLLTWVPIALTFKYTTTSKFDAYRWFGVVFIEILVVIAGSKPGAGVHHLIPIVVLNSFLYDIQLRQIHSTDVKFSSIKIGFVILALYVLSFVWKNIYESEIKSNAVIESQFQAKQEIQILNEKFPNLLMGVTDKENDNYRLTFLRPYLVKPTASQFEFAGFMDLNYSGVSDKLFATELEHCKYKYIAMPNSGAPFSIVNFYTDQPLFSEVTRNAFHDHYRPQYIGAFFSVYECR